MFSFKKTIKFKQNIRFHAEIIIFWYFRSFAAVFYHEICLKKKKPGKIRTRPPPPPPSFIYSDDSKVYWKNLDETAQIKIFPDHFGF